MLRALGQGAAGGIIAAFVSVMAAMCGAEILHGMFTMPLKWIASVPLGTPPSEMSPWAGFPMGLSFHAAFSVFFGIVFALILMYALTYARFLRRFPVMIASAGAIYGAVIWLLDFYVLAPALGRPWFTHAPMLPPAIYHFFFFGAVLGSYCAFATRKVETR